MDIKLNPLHSISNCRLRQRLKAIQCKLKKIFDNQIVKKKSQEINFNGDFKKHERLKKIYSLKFASIYKTFCHDELSSNFYRHDIQTRGMAIAELLGDDPSDERSRTFVFEGEGHTLGNALRSVISRYPEVTFCGYTVPHPADDKINFRIQTSGPKAIDILRRGLTDLEEHCAHIMETFQQSVTNFTAS